MMILLLDVKFIMLLLILIILPFVMVLFFCPNGPNNFHGGGNNSSTSANNCDIHSGYNSCNPGYSCVLSYFPFASPFSYYVCFNCIGIA